MDGAITNVTFLMSFVQHLEFPLYVPITCICCVNMNQMMVATKSERIFRIRWDGVEERDFSLDLKRIPFSINQQVSYGEFKLFIFTVIFIFGLSIHHQMGYNCLQLDFDMNFVFHLFSRSNFGKQYIRIVNGIFSVNWWLCNHIEWWTSGLFDSQLTEIRSECKYSYWK